MKEKPRKSPEEWARASAAAPRALLRTGNRRASRRSRRKCRCVTCHDITPPDLACLPLDAASLIALGPRPPPSPPAPRRARSSRSPSQGGVTIKLMTVGLLAITAYHSYQMHVQKKFPWQQGITVSDLKILLPGSKGRKE